MKHFLIVVDMQKDFVDGALGTPEAVAIVPAVCDRIRAFDGEIIVTYDTHPDTYLATAEGKKLPVVHCVVDTDGWQLDTQVAQALAEKEYLAVRKPTFGSTDLPFLVHSIAGEEEFDITLIGLCTDICVVSNALLLKAHFPEVSIAVESALCAGVTPETHIAALQTMRMCQIDVK
ncbi:MAG: cysteine hydrolase [Clostridia bacterium]|nr:cysteine hydrolase [Clostridia bacterium]